MKKRILTFIICICMLLPVFTGSVADTLRPGDTNGDGKITAADAALALRHAVGLDRIWDRETRMLNDFDCDGTVGAEDGAAILRHVAGISSLKNTKTDSAILASLNKQSLVSDELTEWVARFIQVMPNNSDVRKVLLAGATYLGTPYGTKDGQMDCSRFVATAYSDAGIAKTLYPQKSSDGTMTWYLANKPDKIHPTTENDWKSWTPGSVLIYINDATGKGSHLALYVGEIDGEPIVMESRRSGCDGVRLGYLMGSSESWDLVYYVDPLN